MEPDQHREKRKHQRVPFDCPLAIFSPNGMSFGEAINISQGGMLIKGRESVEPGDVVKVLFKYPLSNRPQINEATVVWVSPHGKIIQEGFGIGVRFTNLEEEDMSHLTSFITSS